MIKRFLDHSANERTYLSWITASIALMAFGFVIERFDIFITYVSKAFGESTKSYLLANTIGVSFLVLAIIIIAIATIRFFIYKRAIDTEKPLPYGATFIVIILGSLMVFLGIFLAVYMATHFANIG